MSEHTDLEAAKETIKTLIGRIDILCATNAKLLVALNAMLRAHPLSGTRCACPAHKLAREAIKEAKGE